MAILVLLRHGRTTANTEGVLAGWTPGVGLDDTGRAQATAAATRLGALPWRAVLSSPLQRCRETLQVVLGDRADVTPVTDERIGECRYGDWEGRPLKQLAKEPMWKVVQSHPSAAVFPGGEPLAATSARAVAAVREWDGRITAEYGPDALWLACSHGDVIKAIVADALGLHLDQFQRITAAPCSVTVIRYTPLRPFVVHLNDLGSDLSGLVPKKRRRRRPSSDAAVGGGAG
ncbi:phosphatase [Actinocatenispora thailandica]|uniref:Phosphatase n=1 Tax=Actinocatenispora thailandica TaxID=227318 RepID=A0A7R7HXZ6_9ACTN|nr:histidine phosphatase family protein [Actinocatenispora thailandica]BCJ35659.1 phosphatase [Actinocatenispora thailandica]